MTIFHPFVFVWTTVNKCMDRYYNEDNFQQYLRDLKAAGKLPGQQPPQSQQH